MCVCVFAISKVLFVFFYTCVLSSYFGFSRFEARDGENNVRKSTKTIIRYSRWSVHFRRSSIAERENSFSSVRFLCCTNCAVLPPCECVCVCKRHKSMPIFALFDYGIKMHVQQYVTFTELLLSQFVAVASVCSNTKKKCLLLSRLKACARLPQ